MVSYNFDFLPDEVPIAPTVVVSAPAGLETIKHLADKVCDIWGTAELDAFLSHLIMDARDGTRNGLPLDVAAEVLFLAHLNKGVRAIDLSVQHGVSFDEAFATIDEGDRTRARNDLSDDPPIARDAVARRSPPAAQRAQRTALPSAGSQVAGLLDILLMLARNRLLLGIIVITLGGKLLWPTIRSLL